jgi:hypothetical protein
MERRANDSSEYVVEYRRLGTLIPVAFSGVRGQEVWCCVECGAVVALRGNHDQWHRLNDSPLTAHIGSEEIDRGGPPLPRVGQEWRGLRAEDSLSLIPPDPDKTYFVRVNQDGTFTVGVDATIGSQQEPGQ